MDADTFKINYLPYYPKLYRIACRIVQDTDDAEDLVQDTYVRLWNKRHELVEVASPEGFAIIVLKNTCMDFLRKQKNNTTSNYENEITGSIYSLSQVEERDQLNLVYSLIGKLPFKQRQVFHLKHWEGYSDEEIEQLTGLKKGNIKVMLSRIRKAIKEQFLKIEQL